MFGLVIQKQSVMSSVFFNHLYYFCYVYHYIERTSIFNVKCALINQINCMSTLSLVIDMQVFNCTAGVKKICSFAQTFNNNFQCNIFFLVPATCTSGDE